MLGIITVVYFLFALCVVLPPDEVVAAGLTVRDLLDGFLYSENTKFVQHHMRRIGLTVFVQSLLPMGYVMALWGCGYDNAWMPFYSMAAVAIPTITAYILCFWFDLGMDMHPTARALQPYLPESGGWRDVAAGINSEFTEVDKVIVPLSTNSKLVVTPTWLVKVTLYRVYFVKHDDYTLRVTNVRMIPSTESAVASVQQVTVRCEPRRAGVRGFSFRVEPEGLQQLAARLPRPVQLPDNMRMLPTQIERFLELFRDIVAENPLYYSDKEPDTCIGCMSVPADMKITKRCRDRADGADPGVAACQNCSCKPLWCWSCLARWWAARAAGPDLLACAGSCPLCRAVFCLRDVSFVSRVTRLRPAE